MHPPAPLLTVPILEVYLIAMEEYNLTNTSGYDLAVTNASGTIELGDREFYIVSSGGPGQCAGVKYLRIG